MNCANVGPAAAGPVQLSPPGQVPVAHTNVVGLHPVRPHILPLYVGLRVAVAVKLGASENPPRPPWAAGKKAGSIVVVQLLKMFMVVLWGRVVSSEVRGGRV